MPSSVLKKSIFVFCSILLVSISTAIPCQSRALRIQKTIEQRLNGGEIIVGLKVIGDKKFVTGKVLISHSLDKVWSVMVNPYEFKDNISPGMEDLEVLTDTAKLSVMKVTIKNKFPVPLPPISYTVRSKYIHNAGGSFIEFQRMAGTLRDFHGFWHARSVNGGTKTEVAYSMYLDPGFYVPQWIIRKGVSGELPKTLSSLRTRVNSICTDSARPESRSISAAPPLRISVNNAPSISKHL